MEVIIIGTGNAATVLGRQIKLCGHIILQVVGRNIVNTQFLAKEFDAQSVTDIHAISKNAELYIIAVSDAAIKQIGEELILTDQLIVHTSGAASKNLLTDVSKRYGVLYPLQSLRKELLHIPEIPFLIEGNTDEVLKIIADFARSISTNVTEIDAEQRFYFHLAAVIVSNFTNHLYALAEEFCRANKVDFFKLAPLIAEVAERAGKFEPGKLQTGPAMRNDKETIEKHLETLNSDKQLKKIYEVFTESIKGFNPQ